MAFASRTYARDGLFPVFSCSSGMSSSSMSSRIVKRGDPKPKLAGNEKNWFLYGETSRRDENSRDLSVKMVELVMGSV
ncbi:hypothetical protein V6N13_144898 [Hibiscus sabdariffa]